MSTGTLVVASVALLGGIVFLVDATRFLLGICSAPVGLDNGQFKPDRLRRFLKHAAVAFIIGMFAFLILLLLFDVPLMAEGQDVMILLIMIWPFMSAILVGILYSSLLHDTCAQCGHPLGLQRQKLTVIEKVDVQWKCKFCRHAIWRVELPDDVRWRDAIVPGSAAALFLLPFQLIYPSPWPLMILIWGFLSVIFFAKFKAFGGSDGGDGGE